MDSGIVLKINGRAYEGWTGVTVNKSMFSLCGAFGLSGTDIFPGRPANWGIKLGDSCSVEINGQKIITGYVEDIPISYDEKSHNIQIGGRDKTGDLVDCSFNGDANEWSGLKVVEVIQRLCNPFGITVVADSTVESLVSEVWPENFKANEGDTVFDLIAKVCKMTAVLPISYGDGFLTLTQTGTKARANDPLELGRNVKKGAIDQSNKDRFQEYIVKGQGVGNDFKDVLSISGPTGSVTDSVINRYRPIIILAETPCDSGRCVERAKWESNLRAGKSRKLTYEVVGWTQSNGRVWSINSSVKVTDEFLGIFRKDLLIAELNFSLDQGGTITTMTVVDKKAFETLLPEQISTQFDNPQSGS